MLESIELWEVVLWEDNVLSEQASLQLQKAVSDRIDGVLETLVTGHVVHILENLAHVWPVLHHEHTSSIDVEDLHWRDERIFSLLISLRPDYAFESDGGRNNDITMIETTKIAQLLFLSYDLHSYSEKITIFLELIELLLVQHLKALVLFLNCFKNSTGITDEWGKDK